MLTQAGLALASLIPQALGARELGRITPHRRSARAAEPALGKGFEKHLDDMRPGNKVDIRRSFNEPDSKDVMGAMKEAFTEPNRFASSSFASKEPKIAINPNADEVYYAHELGHLASQQNDVGHLVASLRENPKLSKALMGAMISSPIIASAVQAGDEDLDESIALAALSASPALADEVLANVNAVQVMRKGGIRPSLGQYGKMAGGLMSYLAVPTIIAAGGNVVGNMLD